MPLFCSNKPYIVILALAVSAAIFILMYATSFLLLTQYYDDPSMFKPNSQDYFRTSLLGLFSPFLFYFLKSFLFDVDGRFLKLNLFFDFPLNDWFMLLLIVCLAYPQIQAQTNSLYLGDDGGDFATSEWHIIPRQAYIFGIAWSLGEFCIAIISNLFNYEEVEYDSLNDHNMHDGDYLMNGKINGLQNASNENQRDNITLSQCIKVRAEASVLSNNVYTSLNENSDTNYGSINKSTKKQHSNTPSGYHNGNNTNLDVMDGIQNKTILVDPTDNSLRIADKNPDGEASGKNRGRHSKIHDNNNVDLEFNDFNELNGSKIHKFFPISSTEELIKQLSLLSLVLLGNILLTVGQSLITSIYFIFVRGHERLFTQIVNFFGSRSITTFILCVITPLSLMNYLLSIIIFYWKNYMNYQEEVESNSTINDHSDVPDAEYFNENRFRPRSKSIMEFYHRYNNNNDDNETKLNTSMLRQANLPMQLNIDERPDLMGLLYTNSSAFYATESYVQSENKITSIVKNITSVWKKLAVNNIFILVMMTLWSGTYFACGIYATIFQ